MKQFSKEELTELGRRSVNLNDPWEHIANYINGAIADYVNSTYVISSGTNISITLDDSLPKGTKNTLDCDCGGESAKTTHAHWCSKGNRL